MLPPKRNPAMSHKERTLNISKQKPQMCNRELYEGGKWDGPSNRHRNKE